MTWDVEGGLALALARGAAVAALLSAFGSLVFRTLVLPRVPGTELRPRIARFVAWSLAAALALLPMWLVLQSAALADTGLAGGLQAAPSVLGGTVFGRVLAAQLAATALAWLLHRRWPAAALAPAAAALALQAAHGHGYAIANGPGLLAWTTAVHLLSAGAWLGSLWPLLVVVRHDTPRNGAMAARWFSPLGKWCVAGMAGSALVQSWLLVGGLPGLIGTPYGRVALVKITSFAALLAFAWVNRYRLAPALLRPALLRPAPDEARTRLVRSVALQTAVGLAAVLAAGLLASLPPGAHEQPVWPFAMRPSLVALAEPELAADLSTGAALLAAAALVVTAALLAVALTRWPSRRPLLAAACALAAALAWFAAPHLSPLLVEAYPTSYAVSPTGFAAGSIRRGTALYPAHCAACHGVDGHGDGPAAASLPVPPADLTAMHLWEHTDGDLFWWVSHGMQAPDGRQTMPGFADSLSEPDRWALIDAVRARNAGLSAHAGEGWAMPVPLPAFALVCPDGTQPMTRDMHGPVLLLRLAAGAVTVQPARPGTAAPCATHDAAAWTAIAIVTGQAPDHADGTRLLVDAQGWLRGWTPRDDPRWDRPETLADRVAAIEAAPLAPNPAHRH